MKIQLTMLKVEIAHPAPFPLEGWHCRVFSTIEEVIVNVGTWKDCGAGLHAGAGGVRRCGNSQCGGMDKRGGAFVARESHKNREAELERYVKLMKEDGQTHNYVSSILRLELGAAKVVPILTDLLNHKSESIRTSALYGLGTFGREAQSTLPDVVRLFESDAEPYQVKNEAARTLGEIADNVTTVGLLLAQRLNAMSDDTMGVWDKSSMNVIVALGKFRDDNVSRAAAPALQKFLNHPHGEVQYQAFMALGQMAGQAVSRENISEARLFAGPPLEQYAALEYVRQEGQESSPIHRQLHDAIVEPASPLYLRARSIEVFSEVGRGDALFTDAMLGALEFSDPFMQHLAGLAMRKINPEDLNNIPVLISGLKPPQFLVRYHAARSLVRFGAEAAPAVPALCQALRDVDGKTELHQIGALLDALRAIGPKASAATETLMDILPANAKAYIGRNHFDTVNMQGYILLTISEVGEVPDAAFPYIMEILSTESKSDKFSSDAFACAARAAGAMGPRGAQAVPWLTKALEPHFKNRLIKLDQLPPIGYLNSNDEGVTNTIMEAARALGLIGAASRPALPALEQKLGEFHPEGMSSSYYLVLQSAIQQIRDATDS